MCPKVRPLQKLKEKANRNLSPREGALELEGPGKIQPALGSLGDDENSKYELVRRSQTLFEFAKNTFLKDQ